MAWKLCYSHNFSPHKTIIWNNEDITVRRKSIIKQEWIDKNIIFVCDLFDCQGIMLSYERFLRIKSFPVTSKDFNFVTKAFPNGISLLMRSHHQYQETLRIRPLLMINGLDVMDSKCNNKHIWNTFYEKKKISPRGKAFFMDNDWKKAWILPYNYCISNKINEVHIKILHTIYPTNLYFSKFLNIEDKCSFCNMEPESLTHLFYHCAKSFNFWAQLEQYIVCKIKLNILIDCKSVIMTFVHGKHDITYITNLFILYGKFHIHKCKYSKISPNFRSFLHEFKEYMKSLALIETKQSITSTDIYERFFKEE